MSWRTLTPALQKRLARLAVFHGGFTATAAQQIAEADTGHLEELCEKSLLTHDPALDRYTLHPVIRPYAARKRPATDQTPLKHARYYLSLLSQYTEQLQKNEPQESLKLLEPDFDNIRLAWETALDQRKTDWLCAALTPFSTYYLLHGIGYVRAKKSCRPQPAQHATWGLTALLWRTGPSQSRRGSKNCRAAITRPNTIKFELCIFTAERAARPGRRAGESAEIFLCFSLRTLPKDTGTVCVLHSFFL